MRIVQNDVARILLYIAACFLLAALITPHIYNAGKALGDMTSQKTTNAFIDWLGDSAHRAEYPRFFKRSLSFSALVLMPFLVFWLRLTARRRMDEGHWERHLPADQARYAHGQPLRKNPHKWKHLLVGFILAAPLLLLIGYIGVVIDYFDWREVTDWGRVFRKSLTPAIFASLFEEFIFRGTLLGIFIRCIGPWRGIFSLSLVFAAVHFLIPPSGLSIMSPENATSGLRFLILVASRFTAPQEFFGEFLTLFIVGLILGWVRFRTASLWLPIGLHLGWVFAFKFFHRVSVATPDSHEHNRLIIGNDLREGVLSLLALVITALLVHLFLKKQESEKEA